MTDVREFSTTSQDAAVLLAEVRDETAVLLTGLNAAGDPVAQFEYPEA